MSELRTAVVGCGLIGTRRANAAANHPDTSLELVIDVCSQVAERLANELTCRKSHDWSVAIEDPAIQIIIVSTPNSLLAPIAIAAMEAGKDVLIEKPMGCNLNDALTLCDTARKTGRSLKVGFNHRYYPAICKARELVTSGEVGNVINIRARYGHGGRPGYEAEWRGDLELAGGGELTDQGVHLIDLINWFVGPPSEVYAALQTAVWPIAPLEDNAFAILKHDNGIVASFHTSWTQWKNLFSFEVFGTDGFVAIEGIGRSYGSERLLVAKRKPEGGVPDMSDEVFDDTDNSWREEWKDFVSHLTTGALYLGTPEDGVAAMRILDALYRSSKLGQKVGLEEDRAHL
ncbi:MAG: Gfo/Idh/MocA family oxidoreductase [Actinobacteria bacterium]|nr:Gfo/Idh/MocA family oxidoreductase [Actinomycetota bacterium]